MFFWLPYPVLLYHHPNNLRPHLVWMGNWMPLVHSLGQFWFILAHLPIGEFHKNGIWRFRKWRRLGACHFWQDNSIIGFKDCRPLGTGEENYLSVRVLGPAEPLICKLCRKEEGHSPWRLSPWWDKDTHLLVWPGPLLAHAELERDKKGWELKKISRSPLLTGAS